MNNKKNHISYYFSIMLLASCVQNSFALAEANLDFSTAEASKDSLDRDRSFDLVSQYPSPDIQAIKDSGKLRIAIYGGGERPPFFMHDKKGNLIGIDIDLGKAIAKKLGVKADFNLQADSFDGLVELVSSGQADIGISKLSLTLNRAEIAIYSDPYVNMGKAILINRLALEKLKKSSGESLKDLFEKKGATIGVIAKSSYVTFAARIFPKAKIIPMKSWDNEIIPKLLKGEIIAAFRDEWETLKVMNKVPNASLTLQQVIIKEEEDPIKIVLPWNSTHLREWINHYIDTNKINYNVKDLLEKYENYLPAKELAQK